MRTAALAALVFAPMIVEARRAWRNERAQRTRGGVEPAGDVYAVMQTAYPGAFALMLAEGWWRGAPRSEWTAVGLVVFLAAKLLKWWAILALGPFWTFRVIVVPGAALVARGPYRFMRHPNYAAVALELAGAAVMTGAAVSGPLAVVLFSILMRKRIGVEDRALGRAPAPALRPIIEASGIGGPGDAGEPGDNTGSLAASGADEGEVPG
jgi:methyltransferase